jgi:GMP synthase (glutamine-hydrolysing)
MNSSRTGLAGNVWHFFTVVPDFKSVGVKNNARCFGHPMILRAVNTVDAMTASMIEEIPYSLLHKDY